MPGASSAGALLSEAMRLQARAGISEMRSIVDMEAPAGTKWRTQCPLGDRPEAEVVGLVGGGFVCEGIAGAGNKSVNDQGRGTITISGGTIDATGGYDAAGIGTGEIGNCGNITITDGVTRVTATKGGGWAQHSIGRGGDGDHFQYHGKVNFTGLSKSKVGRYYKGLSQNVPVSQDISFGTGVEPDWILSHSPQNRVNILLPVNELELSISSASG